MLLPPLLLAAGWLAGCDPSPGAGPAADDTAAPDGGSTDGGASDGGASPVDEAPLLTWQTPREGEVVGEGQPVALTVAVQDDGEPALQVTFRSSVEGELGTVEALPGAAATLAWSPREPGAHTITAWAQDAALQGAEARLGLTVDGLPSAPTLEIQPAAPTTEDPLTCVVLADGLDPEGGPVETTLLWLRDGEETGNVGPVLGAEHTTRGERWTCQGRSTDGRGGSEAAEASVSIGNSPPGPPVLALSARVPVAGRDDLVCLLAEAARDADGDPLSYRFAWSRDGAAWEGVTTTTTWEGDTVLAATLGVGERWACQAWARDAEAEGEGAQIGATVGLDPGEVPAGELSAEVADAWFPGGASGDYVGTAAAFVGDLDGDGVQDLALGAMGFDGGGRVASGAALLHRGPVFGERATADAIALYGPQTNATAGRTLLGPGDLDGDGYDDLLIGAEESRTTTSHGQVFLVAGPITADLDLGLATATLERDAAGGALGRALAAVGDQTGDGRPDVLVAGDAGDGGGVFLLSGPLAGVVDPGEAAAVVLASTARGDDLGACLAGPGDVDGDGLSDLLTGAPGYLGRGAAALWWGPLTDRGEVAWLDDADGLWLGGEGLAQEAGCGLGRVGDLDGDGRDDLAIGAADDGEPSAEEGVVFVVTSPAEGSALLAEVATTTIRGAADGDLLGQALAGADLDADGASDLVLPAPKADLPEGSQGAAWIFYGPLAAGVTLADADARILGPLAGDQLGGSVAAGGDVNADGYADLLLGGYGADPGGSFSGAGWLFYGGE